MDTRSDCCYVDPPDIPEGMTIDEYRRARRTRTQVSRPGLAQRLLRRGRARRDAGSRRASASSALAVPSTASSLRP